jgi:hypothetical protein
MDDAKEMVYDADLQHEDNKISIDELVTCLEMVGDAEALEDGDQNKSLWRAPSGKHLAKQRSDEDRAWKERRRSFSGPAFLGGDSLDGYRPRRESKQDVVRRDVQLVALSSPVASAAPHHANPNESTAAAAAAAAAARPVTADTTVE